MKNKKKGAPDVGASKGSKEKVLYAKISRYLGILYYTTLFMTITTLISIWHIEDVWDGIITALCGAVTMWLSFATIGGHKDDGKKVD